MAVLLNVIVLLVSLAYVLSDSETCSMDTGECKFLKHNCDHDQFKNGIKRLLGVIGKRYSISKPGDIEDFEIGICTGTLLGKESQDPELSKAAGVQKTSNGELHRIGSLDESEIMAGTNFISLEYEGGETYGTHCTNEPKRTILMIICKEGETQGVFRMVDENNNKTNDCYYLFELEHEAACQAPSSGGLGIGSIVCIVFFSLVLCYLLGGFIYQRFMVGAKGMEQIPNYSFWQDFGNLQADGCDLIFRSSRGRGVAPKQYRGIGDEQLQSHEDVSDRDDHLLPM